jgi:hypothetical protein
VGRFTTRSKAHRRRIGEQTQIGQRIADLGALEEAQSAIDPIGTGLDQRLLEQPRLGRGAIEDGALGAPMAVVDKGGCAR